MRNNIKGNEMSDSITKEQYMVEFIKALQAIEEEMEPYKEHKRDLRKNYVQNGWLSKEELRQAVRAYRMLRSGDDIDEFKSYFDQLNKNIVGA
tara:strand:- start:366 stop:644 length:279 start_codon:yes stop_codon:yes gene_type:complete